MELNIYKDLMYLLMGMQLWINFSIDDSFCIFRILSSKSNQICVFFKRSMITVIEHILQIVYNINIIISSWRHLHNQLILSKTPYEVIIENIDSISITIIKIQEYYLIPIHLHAFSSQSRLDYIQKIIIILDKHKHQKILLIGDYNLRYMGNIFLFPKDKIAYKLLSDALKDWTKNKSTSVIWCKFDKVFISRD